MTLTSDQENAKALAALLGIAEEEAAQRLRFRVAVTCSPTQERSRDLAGHVAALLARTIEYAGPADGGAFVLEIVIGQAQPATTAPLRIYAGQIGSDFCIRRTDPLPDCDATVPQYLLIIAACYAAAAVVKAAIGPGFPIQSTEPIRLSWTELFGRHVETLDQSVDIGEAYLAGAGAVGHGFLYTLRTFDVRGQLFVTDPKAVAAGGLNRCLLFNPDDLGQPKASRLCQVAQSGFPHLKLIPVDRELKEARTLRGADSLIESLIVAVDSRRARRSLQTELPHRVFDASTTDVTEVVLHFNAQPTDLACLCCIYPENERERQHEENVAEALGLGVDEVQLGLITAPMAEKVCLQYPELRPSQLVGRAFDTVYKELCGVGKLQTAGGKQVLAPFSFVSVLAGAFLAVEFVIRLSDPTASRFNYWRLSPWHSPVPALRQQRPRDPNCVFCGKSSLRRAIERIWMNTSNPSPPTSSGQG